MTPAVNLKRYGVLLLLALAVVFSWLSPIDDRAEEIVDQSFNRAALTFGAARALNAVISVVKGTEVTVGVGAEATFSLGEVLDPVDDLVEQFGDLMLVATVSLGIQKVLLAMGQADAVTWALTVLAIVWGAMKVGNLRTPRVITLLLAMLVMARFAIPVTAVVTHELYQAFLSDKYDVSVQGIEDETDRIRSETTWWERLANDEPLEPPASRAGQEAQPESQPAGKEPGWFGRMQRNVAGFFDASKLMSKMNEKFGVLKQSAELTAAHVIDLIVVFLLETLLVPLAVIWLMYVGVRSLLSAAETRQLNDYLESVVRHTRASTVTA